MLSYFPTKWKEAVIIPVRKPGKPASDVSSYRPISVLPTMSKIFDRIILTRMKAHVEDRQLIPNFQFGFRSEHSTTHQLLRVMNQIKTGFDRTQSTGMVLLDLKCAFNSVWHDGVIYKMEQYGFLLYLTKLIQSFLDHRRFSVKVNNNMSELKTIPAGVPQGAIISPIIFNIFMSDFLTDHPSTTAQYDDDVVYLATAKQASSVKKHLQNAVNIFSKYVRNWRLKINPQKSEAVFFTRRRHFRAFPKKELVIEDHNVPWCDSAKYLGVTNGLSSTPPKVVN